MLLHAERVEGKDKAAFQTGCDLPLPRVDAGLAPQATLSQLHLAKGVPRFRARDAGWSLARLPFPGVAEQATCLALRKDSQPSQDPCAPPWRGQSAVGSSRLSLNYLKKKKKQLSFIL